jgi:hypothetical protein
MVHVVHCACVQSVVSRKAVARRSPDSRRGFYCIAPLSLGEGPGVRVYTTPWSNIASATFTKPAMFAPFT